MTAPPTSADVETMTFGDLVLDLDPHVLRPRAWTLAQSEWAVELMVDVSDGPVLELCSGAGHIGLATMARHDRRLVQVDASAAACELAVRHARRAGHADRVEVRHGPMRDVVTATERFPLVIADPPWVASGRTDDFPDDPLSAIDGGADGLELALECVATIDRVLTADGSAVLQLGSLDQAAALVDGLADDVVDLRVLDVRSHEPDGVLLHLAR